MSDNRRKRSNSASLTLQTIRSNVHAKYFASFADLKETEEKIKLINDFFNFSFLEGCSIKQFDIPDKFNINCWDSKLISKHISILENMKNEDEATNTILTSMYKFVECEEKCENQICETANICEQYLTESDFDTKILFDLDDKYYFSKKQYLRDLSEIETWFVNNKDDYEKEFICKFAMLVSYWVCKKQIKNLKECLEKIYFCTQKNECENIIDKVYEKLSKDEDICNLLSTNVTIFPQLSNRINRDKDKSSVVFSESYFRNARAQWNSLYGTPGFEGSQKADHKNFSTLCKVLLFTKGEFAGFKIEDLKGKEGFNDITMYDKNHPNVVEVDIFTVDRNFKSKISEYLQKPSYLGWRKYVENMYIPGSALFFHPSIYSTHPDETSKPAYIAFIEKRPLHCFHKNNKTEQGFNLAFYILSWSAEHCEWYLGSQEEMESKNSNQRRRIILEKNQAVLATQLPGKKNIDVNYFNTIYYGERMCTLNVQVYPVE